MKMGYTNVYIMPAGIDGWEKAGLATEAGAPTKAAGAKT